MVGKSCQVQTDKGTELVLLTMADNICDDNNCDDNDCDDNDDLVCMATGNVRRGPA